jgi:putative ABC transport system ATP-binding protein
VNDREPLLDVIHATKVYSTEKVRTSAVNDLSATVSNGELIAITGPSGSGKSTLLSLLGLLDRPTQGDVLVRGVPTAALAGAERSRLRNRTFAYVFQNFSLVPQLSAMENVELPLLYRNVAAAERRQRAAETLSRVGLGHRLEHLPSQLSGGEQQRVAIARAIVSRPLAVLADEPTGNLDSENARGIVDLLLELHASGSAVILVSHDAGIAALAERRIALRDGRVVEDARRARAKEEVA